MANPVEYSEGKLVTREGELVDYAPASIVDTVTNLPVLTSFHGSYVDESVTDQLRVWNRPLFLTPEVTAIASTSDPVSVIEGTAPDLPAGLLATSDILSGRFAALVTNTTGSNRTFDFAFSLEGGGLVAITSPTIPTATSNAQSVIEFEMIFGAFTTGWARWTINGIANTAATIFAATPTLANALTVGATIDPSTSSANLTYACSLQTLRFERSWTGS